MPSRAGRSCRAERPRGATATAVFIGLSFAVPASANLCGESAAGEEYFWAAVAGDSLRNNNCFGQTGFRCYQGIAGAPFVRLQNPACDPTAGPCTVELRVPFEFPGVEQMVAEDTLFASPTPVVYWFAAEEAPACPGTTVDCGQEMICGVPSTTAGKINADFLETWVERAGVTCANAAEQTEIYSLRAIVCRNACRVDTVVDAVSFGGPALAAAIGCPKEPPPWSCGEPNSCTQCRNGTSVGGGGASTGGGGGNGPFGPGAEIGTYNLDGQLDFVDFPDGRRDDFGYDGGGRLVSIAEVGTDGLTTRTWTYTWSGDDLVRVDRPDGTAWVMTYDNLAHPGYMTLLELEGTDGTSRRVEQGWDYDGHGNAVRTWRGAAAYGDAAAVDKWEMSFDDPLDPTMTTVTDPLEQTILYTVGRDTVSDKPRVEAIQGGCPGCGLESDTAFLYGAEHPLLPIQQTDAEGNVTTFTYTASGEVATRTEAANEPLLARTTTFTYDVDFPGLVIEIEQPSTAGGANVRRTEITRDASGDPTTRTIEGIEAGSPFSLPTATAFNGAGLPLSIDPPGYASDDAITFTYDGALGDLVLTSRSDPLAGATTFDHDAFNRRTSVVDPNGIESTTAYDALDRVTTLVHKGAIAGDNLVTLHTYDIFGDLVQTTLPEGNLIRYGYDAAGRLTSVERRTSNGSERERTVYVLDGAGNRTSEQHERWDGADWVAESWTDFEYWSRCHLGRVLHADGSVTRYDYDCNGKLEKVWDANHPFADEVSTPPTETYAYDALDRLVEVRQAWGGEGGGEAVTEYDYDVQDHLTTVTDAEGNTTTYTYSDRDLLIEEVSPASGGTIHAYNEHGELLTTSDARGSTMTRVVDAAGRVTALDYPARTRRHLHLRLDAGALRRWPLDRHHPRQRHRRLRLRPLRPGDPGR